MAIIPALEGRQENRVLGQPWLQTKTLSQNNNRAKKKCANKIKDVFSILEAGECQEQSTSILRAYILNSVKLITECYFHLAYSTRDILESNFVLPVCNLPWIPTPVNMSLWAQTPVLRFFSKACSPLPACTDSELVLSR